MHDDKVVLITGATGGIGSSIARKFAQHPFKLILLDVDLDALELLKKQLEEEWSATVMICCHDLEQIEKLPTVLEEIYAQCGRIDVLINNAAWRTVETMRQIELDTWEKTLRICLTAPAFLAKWVAEKMENRNQSGVIINLSSVMSQRTGGTSPAYVACKGGIESLTYELAALYGPKNIRVVAISPGNIQTKLSEDFINDKGETVSADINEDLNRLVPMGRSGTPLEVANVCYWISTEEASFITGTNITVDGGFSHNFNSYLMKKKHFPNEF